MMAIFSDLLTCVIILLITLILNGDLGIKKLPFYALLRHRRLIQQPYVLLYFYMVSSFTGGLSNSSSGLWLFIVLVLIQSIIIIFLVTKYAKKGFMDWNSYMSRLKQIFTKFLNKKSSEHSSALTLQDITYFLQNFVFPCVFVLSNAYLIVNIILILKQK